jgi:hypothetical protein
MENLYTISQTEFQKLLAGSYQIGYWQAGADIGEESKYISLNQAFKIYRESRVRGWIKNNKLKFKTNGNG